MTNRTSQLSSCPVVLLVRQSTREVRPSPSVYPTSRPYLAKKKLRLPLGARCKPLRTGNPLVLCSTMLRSAIVGREAQYYTNLRKHNVAKN